MSGTIESHVGLMGIDGNTLIEIGEGDDGTWSIRITIIGLPDNDAAKEIADAIKQHLEDTYDSVITTVQ